MNFTRISMQDWQAEGEKRSDSQSLVTLKDLKEEFENYPRLKNFEKSVTEHTEAILANVQSKEEELHLKFTKLLNMEKMLNNKLEEFQHQVKVKEKELLQLEKKLKEDFDDKVKEFQEEKKRMKIVNGMQETKIDLNVGGHPFTTSKLTLCAEKNSMLDLMFSGQHELAKAENGSYFIDRDGTYFRHILNYLRGRILIPSDLPEDKNILKELRHEVDFYQLNGMAELIDDALGNSSMKTDYKQCEINEMRVFDSSRSSKTCKELNFEYENLNGLSFSHTTFLHNASFIGTSLTNASFYGSVFLTNNRYDFMFADLRGCDFRQCKGTEVGPNMSYNNSGRLMTVSSTDIFCKMIRNNEIRFHDASNIELAIFDSKVFQVLKETGHIVPDQV